MMNKLIEKTNAPISRYSTGLDIKILILRHHYIYVNINFVCDLTLTPWKVYEKF